MNEPPAKLDYATTVSGPRPRRKNNYRFWNITFWVSGLLIIYLVSLRNMFAWFAAPLTILNTIAWILVKGMRRARWEAQRKRQQVVK